MIATNKANPKMQAIQSPVLVFFAFQGLSFFLGKPLMELGHLEGPAFHTIWLHDSMNHSAESTAPIVCILDRSSRMET